MDKREDPSVFYLINPHIYKIRQSPVYAGQKEGVEKLRKRFC